MELVELLTVEERFQLSSIGLALLPDFPVRDGWKSISEEVLVLPPGGEEFTAQAQFNTTHVNFGSAPTEEQRARAWRVVVSLVDVDKAAVPVGSRVLVKTATRRALFGDAHVDGQ